MNTEQQQFDVAVVGGGVAGLTAAAFAARKGLRTILFERSERIGGRAISTRDRDYVFNLGPHALFNSHFRKALVELDVPFSGTVPKKSQFVERAGRFYPLPATTTAILTTRLFDFRDRLAFSRALMRLQKPSPEALAELSRTSITDWLDANITRPTARAAANGIFRLVTYADAPDIISMDTLATQIAVNPVLYIDGGWQTLSDGLHDAVLRAGVRVRSQTRVEEVAPTSDGFAVTATGGETVRAQTVIMALEPGAAAKIVQGSGSATLTRWSSAAVPSHAAVLDVALTRLPQPRRPWVLSLDSPHFISAQSSYAKLAPGEGASLVATRYLAPGENGATVEPELEAQLDRLHPGWREHVVYRRFMPALVAVNDLPQASRGGLSGRPGPEVPGAEGLFVAGDWVGSEGTLADASAASAREAVRLAERHLHTAARPRPVSIVA